MGGFAIVLMAIRASDVSESSHHAMKMNLKDASKFRCDSDDPEILIGQL